ncbi:DNA polymerase alpha catalytic subunit [Naegleria gruberi]|uniref:DNA polymerase n=1 Tax=Naegleria gruberi TaxID=5762 RepID=D2UXH8_NAEGR|nr:DNA polymerase alpha catalytic subunit [Naegleria gruberi]EFC50634.1 DNA polymerase alpha catalytic subunit [Naegleria gruberi]|eukprot:XP_002683378.1 DNA polymerase alpha catalytic subunit [Naegleria gruberi strain NEG-M]
MKRRSHEESDSEQEEDFDVNTSAMSDEDEISASPQQKRHKLFSSTKSGDVKEISILPDDFKSKIPFIEQQDQFIKNQTVGFSLEGKSKLDFYFVDSCELDGRIILFGKIETLPNNYASCCVRLEKVQKTIYFLPREPIEAKLVNQEQESRIQEELSEVLKISPEKFGFKFKERKYIFEDADVPYNKSITMVKVVIFDVKNLKPHLQEFRGSKLFSKVFHATTSGLEEFILKRKLMGPSWLSIQKFHVKSSGQLSWCKFEVSTDEPTNISVINDDRSPPPLVLMSLKVKTIHNEEKKVNEIVAVCCILQEYSFTGQQSQRKKFIVARKVDDNSVDSNGIELEFNETSLINRLMAQIQQYDPDMYIGHSFLSFELDIILQRWKALKGTDGVLWSRVGRLRLSRYPMLQPLPGGMNESTKSEKESLAGRLVCDTYIAVKEYLREKSYSLEDLRVSQLGETPLEKDIRNPLYDGNLILTAKYFSSVEGVEKFCAFVEHDAQVSMDLMEKLSLIPLTKELTNAAGNLWNRTLIGSRSERIEYLLLHEFYKQKYILPDKSRAFGKRGGRKPKYSGGLVLDPKSGFHHNYVLLLDFNSLYPSIILENNICFSNFLYTEEEREEHKNDKTVLPLVIETLLSRRRQAQRQMEQATGVQRWQYDMRQRALKLTANSTYGCLGFTFSRFFCKQMAESITVEGRNILTQTKQLIENSLRFSVIYGDTDSVMIATDTTNYDEALSKGEEIKKEINNSFRKGKGKLEIDIDGLFRRMLLLRKKKYGALIHTKNKQGTIIPKLELKGLDMVRRDWCDLSRNVSQYIIDQILRPNEPVDCQTQPTPEEIVANIHTHLREIADDVRNNRVPLEQYILTTALTKEPEQYTDAINHPHVQVALEMRRNGQAVRLHQRIPFVITLRKDGTSSSKVSERAVHPDTFRAEQKDNNLELDYEWYLAQQVFPPVSRLCEYLQQTDKALIAECLGLEKKYFRTSYGDDDNMEEYKILSRQEEYDEFEGIELPVNFTCDHCSNKVNLDLVSTLTNAISTTDTDMMQSITILDCPHCKSRMSTNKIVNLSQLNIRELIKKYYSNELKPSASNYRANISDSSTHVISMQPGGYGVFNGSVVSVKQTFTPQDLQVRLRYLARMFDWSSCVKATFKKIDKEQYSSLEKLKAVVQEMQKQEIDELGKIYKHVSKYLQRNARQMVNLSDLFKLVSVDN